MKLMTCQIMLKCVKTHESRLHYFLGCGTFAVCHHLFAFPVCVIGRLYSSYTSSLLFYDVLLIFITKTYLYNLNALKPHFNIVKLGFTGVNIIFFLFC